VDDGYADDNYVRKVLAKERPLPPITLSTLPQNIEVISTLALTIVPALAIYGAFTTPVLWKTLVWAVAYYFYTGLGESHSTFVLHPRCSRPSPRSSPFRSVVVIAEAAFRPAVVMAVADSSLSLNRHYSRLPQALGSCYLLPLSPLDVPHTSQS
jgi:hypothetical protein